MRIKRSVNALKKRRKILKLAKGYRASKSTLYRVAREQVMKSGQYAYVGRKLRKRDFRKLWIARINAASRANGLPYNKFMDGLNKSGCELNRKMLSEIAIADPAKFTELCETAKKALAK
ncbi:MAG: 50S ribosomal protein L20 [Christensenellaceae bacterium]|jgi:large subunit ribosomal protein L20|nr:50S ribosomal protein L20 [Christensenellaceae bacterium]